MEPISESALAEFSFAQLVSQYQGWMNTVLDMQVHQAEAAQFLRRSSSFLAESARGTMSSDDPEIREISIGISNTASALADLSDAEIITLDRLAIAGSLRDIAAAAARRASPRPASTPGRPWAQHPFAVALAMEPSPAAPAGGRPRGALLPRDREDQAKKAERKRSRQARRGNRGKR